MVPLLEKKLKNKMNLLKAIAPYNKAFVAALVSALYPLLNAAIEAANQWLLGIVGVLVTGLATYRIPNKPTAEVTE